MARWTAAACSRACWKRSPPRVRTYIGITGLIFALMFAAHLARGYAEGAQIFREPIIIVTTAVSLGLAVWAVFLLARRPS